MRRMMSDALRPGDPIHCCSAFLFGVAGTSPATTRVRDSTQSKLALGGEADPGNAGSSRGLVNQYNSLLLRSRYSFSLCAPNPLVPA